MKLGFKGKIYVGLISLLLMFGVGTYLATSHIMRQALLEENKSRGLLMGSNLAARAADPILAMDFLRLKNLVDEAIRINTDVRYAFIANAQGDVLVHTFKGGFPTELKTANRVSVSQEYNRRLLDTGEDFIHDYAIPVFVGNDRFGTVRLGLMQTRIQKAIDSLSQLMFFSTALVVAFSGLVGAALVRTVGRRIETLHKSIEEVLQGNLEIQSAPMHKKECWEIMKCSNRECPAYRDTSIRCWYLAGTLCPTCVGGEYPQKIKNCMKCPVHKITAGDEIQQVMDSFYYMVRRLKDRLCELRAAEATLTEQENILRTVLNATPDFVSLQDRESVYRVVNKAFCELVGAKETDIVGKSDFELFSERRARSNRNEDLQVLRSGEPLTKEDKIRGAKGTRWIHMVKLPVRDGDGTITGLLCSGRDITDFKKFQERLTQSQKMEATGRLTAGIAHEINTPLGIILGYVQLLLEDVEPESQIHDDLRIVEKHTQICRKIVSDLLRFSRHTETHMAPLKINEIIEESLSVVEHTFRLDRVLIQRDLDPDIPEVVGDNEKLRQAIVNLVNNAFDAIGTDGLISVATGLDEDSGELLISVADTGKGIPSENLDRIFEPFFTTKGVGEGTGLGLSVTFGIVKDHGGGIEVRSPLPPAWADKMRAAGYDGEAGRGTVFTIHLPSNELDEQKREGETSGDDHGTG